MATDDVVGMTKLNLRENPGVQIDSDREALALLREASAPARRTILADKAKKVGRPRNGVFMTMQRVLLSHTGAPGTSLAWTARTHACTS